MTDTAEFVVVADLLTEPLPQLFVWVVAGAGVVAGVGAGFDAVDEPQLLVGDVGAGTGLDAEDDPQDFDDDPPNNDPEELRELELKDDDDERLDDDDPKLLASTEKVMTIETKTTDASASLPKRDMD